jgi:urease accessory protein
MTEMINTLLGYASDAEVSEQLHSLGHQSAVEYVIIKREDTLRRRLRVQTDKGTECLVALPREQQLVDGAILLLETNRAIVTRMVEEQWLCLQPTDMSSAVELGYFVGNLHWRVQFDGPMLRIALEGPEQDYLTRLEPYLNNNRAKQIVDERSR